MSLWEIYKAKRLGYADDLWTSLIGHQLGGYSWLSDYETTPYLYRAMPNLSHYYNREIMEEVVGGSVAWNQQIQNGNFADASGWAAQDGEASLSVSNGVATVTKNSGNPSAYSPALGFASGYAPKGVVNHIYFLAVDVFSPINTKLYNGGVGSIEASLVADSWTQVREIYKATQLASQGYVIGYLGLSPSTGIGVGDSVSFKNFNLIDLTQMFGSTIADYIYSLEQATAGAGVAWFKKLFNKPYYAYNAGELLSVSGVSAHNMTGFNQWDEEWETGAINGTSGENEASSVKIRSKNYIPVIPSQTYFFNVGGTTTSTMIRTRYYDADKNYIGAYDANGVSGGAGTTRTMLSNAHYMRFDLNEGYGTTYNHDICINLSWDGSEDGNYEPYQKWSYPLDSDLELRGKFKLDANNNLYADGDVYPPSGQVQRKWSEEITFDGSSDEGWGMPATGYFAIAVSNLVDDNSKQTIISDRYLGNSWASITGVSLDMAVGVVNGATIRFRNSAITSLNDWKTWLSNNNTTVVYELATPTTETAQPFTKTQLCDSGGTEEFVTSGIVSVGHKSKYAEK